MDYNQLRERVKAVLPIDVDGKKFTAAILYHYVKPEAITGDYNILWIRAHKKIQASQIKTSYMSRDFADAGVASPVNVHIVFGDGIVDPTTTLGELNHYDDQLIVLRAIDADSPEGIALSKSQLAAGAKLREPLQAVNRQSSVSTARSPQQSAVPCLTTGSNGDENSSPAINAFGKASNTLNDQAGATTPAPPEQKPTSYQIPPQQLPHLPHGPNDVGQRQAPHEFPLQGKTENTPHHGLPYQAPFPAIPTPSYLPPIPTSGLQSHAFNPDDFLGRAIQHVGYPTPASEQRSRKAETPKRSPSPDLQAQDFLTTSDSQVDGLGGINLDFMQGLMNETDAAVLELAVKKGIQVIRSVRAPMADYLEDNVEATQWLEQLDNIRARAKRTRTVVGVVGNTGAGKSSVINALLDEERLVPTNCMRACTAVVTEISWNEDVSPRNKYRAAIEFITQADWEKELNVLFKDMLDEGGQISRDCTNPDTEAGVAYAKIKAVYPRRTREELTKSSVDVLVDVWEVKNVLGTTKQLNNGDADRFYRSLQKYVDSTAKDGESDKKKPRRMEYWPLIKCVKIYTRSDALSTGAVIVDLPGVQDSNAARAAVAESYMKQCSGLWIVAPINRAVNDKAAKQLLGDQFKRQMKYDGMFSNVTFICSKTDDISVTEAATSLGIEDRVQGFWDNIKALERERKVARAKVDELKEQQECYAQIFADQDALIDIWEELENRLETGETVYAPVEKTKKRKHKTAKPKANKRINLDSDIEEIFDDDDDDLDSDTDSDEASDVEGSQTNGTPLTIQQIKTKVEQLKTTKKDARKEKTRLGGLIRETNKETVEVNAKIKEIKAKIASVCIAGRNDWSRTRIQEDYAMGIKELDQENAIEVDEENFDPDVDLRDYNMIAQSLPVFCVSSRAYQKMSGRLEKDGKVAGFLSEEETELPQLKKHCKKLTEAGRAGTCRVFLNALSQLLLSISLWAGNDGSGIKLTDEQHRVECNILAKRLRELEVAIEKAVESSTDAIESTLAEHVFDHSDNARKAANTMALPTAERWGGPRDSGGLHFMTYKAICRRMGGPFRDVNFNQQLTEPLEKYLVNGWDRCFSKGMPKVLKQFRTDMTHMLKVFHQNIEERARERGVGVVGLRILSQKLETREAHFSNLTDELSAIISEKQKEANRTVTPVIAEAMGPAYAQCVNESGRGSFGRMKAHMTGHVEHMMGKAFKNATETVRAQLMDMALEVEDEMAVRTDDVFREVQKDYMTVIAGVKLPEGYVMPKSERQMREQVAEAVKGAEDIFSKPYVPEAEDEEATDEVGLESKANDAESDIEDDSEASDKESDRDTEAVTKDVEVDVSMAAIPVDDEDRDQNACVAGVVEESMITDESSN